MARNIYTIFFSEIQKAKVVDMVDRPSNRVLWYICCSNSLNTNNNKKLQYLGNHLWKRYLVNNLLTRVLFFRCEAKRHAKYGPRGTPPNVHARGPWATNRTTSPSWTTLRVRKHAFLRVPTPRAAHFTPTLCTVAGSPTRAVEAIYLPDGCRVRTTQVTTPRSQPSHATQCTVTAQP